MSNPRQFVPDPAIEAMLQADYRAELRDLQRRARVGSWSWIVATNTVHWSPELFRVFGVDPSRPAPGYGGHRRLFTPESWARLDAAFDAALKRDVEFNLDLEVVRGDGKRVWITVQGACQRDSEGAPLRLYGITQEITERKLAEEALQRTQERLRVALHAAGAIAYEIDVPSSTVVRSFSSEPALPANEGAPEPVSRVRERVHPDDRERFDTVLRDALASSDEYHGIYRVVRPDGDVRWVESSGKITRDASGCPLRLTGVAFDITESQNAAEQLRLTDERFRMLALATSDVVWDWDMATGIAWRNENFHAMFGYHAGAEADGQRAWAKRVHPDDVDRVSRSVREVIEGQGTTWSGEYRIRRADGTYAEVLDRGHVIRDESGKAVRMIGAMMDVTQERRAERERFETTQRLEALMNALPIGVSFADDDTCKRITGNPALLAMFSAKPGDNLSASAPDRTAPGRGVRYLIDGRPMRPADLPLQRSIAENRVQPSTEIEVRLPSGHTWIAETTAAPIRDAAGKPVAGVAVMADVTRRKQIEAQLRESEQRFRQLAENNLRLLQEVNHRVKNNLTSILGLLTMTASRFADAKSFAGALRDRILAMSRVHELLSAHQWQDVTLHSLVDALLQPMIRAGLLRGSLNASGPEITISPRVATALALVMQELAINSYKYGAHSSPQGVVSIAWAVAETGWTLTWTEEKGPPVAPPPRRGLGHELIEALITHDLAGKVQMTFPASGFVCVIDLTSGASAAASGGADEE